MWLNWTFTVRSCPHSVRTDIPLASKATSYAIPFFTPGRTFFKATFLFNTRNLQWSRCFSFSSAFFALKNVYIQSGIYCVNQKKDNLTACPCFSYQYNDLDAGTIHTNLFLYRKSWSNFFSKYSALYVVKDRYKIFSNKKVTSWEHHFCLDFKKRAQLSCCLR